MYNANALAHVILAHARRSGRMVLTSDDRSTLQALLPRLSGMVAVLAMLALRYYGEVA